MAEEKSLTEEQMLDFFQKEGIAHEQRGGKLFVPDASALPGKYHAYFNEEGFFVDAGKKSVASEVKETIVEEGLGTEAPDTDAADAPKKGDEPASDARKAPAKRTATKTSKKGK